MTLTERFDVARSFFEANGAYIFIARIASYPARELRNRMLAAKFGVRRIDIGPRSFIRGVSSIRVGEDFAAGQGLRLEAVTRHNGERFAPQIIIGNNVSMSDWSHIAAVNYVEIGDGVLIGSKVLITDHNHGTYNGTGDSPTIPPSLRSLASSRRTVIGNNVWLADGVVVTSGSRIGEGSIIGANSVVSGQIPRFVVAAGSPAKAIKQYDFERNEWTSIE